MHDNSMSSEIYQAIYLISSLFSILFKSEYRRAVGEMTIKLVNNGHFMLSSISSVIYRFYCSLNSNLSSSIALRYSHSNTCKRYVRDMCQDFIFVSFVHPRLIIQSLGRVVMVTSWMCESSTKTTLYVLHFCIDMANEPGNSSFYVILEQFGEIADNSWDASSYLKILAQFARGRSCQLACSLMLLLMLACFTSKHESSLYLKPASKLPYDWIKKQSTNFLYQ